MTATADMESDDDEKGGFGSLCVRDTLFFDDKVMLPGVPFEIIVRPEETCLLHRIIMHRGIAGKLALEEMRLGAGEYYRRRGSGSCEVFLAEGIPNWTPQKLYMTKEEPLVIRVRNMSERPVKLVGQTIVFHRERERERAAVKKPASRAGLDDGLLHDRAHTERERRLIASYPLKSAATVAGEPTISTNAEPTEEK